MTPPSKRKSELGHWDSAWAAAPRMRLPSGFNVSVRNLQRLLRQHVMPQSTFLEIGCAPGKILAWVTSELNARVSGLDYSAVGIGHTKKLFSRLGLRGDIRCEDVLATTFQDQSFDLVFSAGFIEHFDDPSEMIKRHMQLVKPGGLVIVTVPNYGGWYGWLLGKFDPEMLAIHNLNIMSPAALMQLVPKSDAASCRAYYAGRLSSWLINWPSWLPKPLAHVGNHLGNLIGLAQPLDIDVLSPMIVLEIRKLK